MPDLASTWHRSGSASGPHLIVAQRTSELQTDFTSIPPMPMFEKLTPPNF